MARRRRPGQPAVRWGLASASPGTAVDQLDARGDHFNPGQVAVGPSATGGASPANGSTASGAGRHRVRLAVWPERQVAWRPSTASSYWPPAGPSWRCCEPRKRERPYLPAGGERGTMAGRSYRRLRLPPHRATSEVLAGAYPFLAEEGLGSAGILVGQDVWSGTAFCYDPWALYRQGELTNPNICLAGQIGRGKSALAKSLACRCIAFGRRVYVPGDPKGEWTKVADAVGGQSIQLSVGSTARLNPLDEGPRPSGIGDAAWRAQVSARRTGLLGALSESTLGRPLAPTERSALDVALSAALSGSSAPVLPMVVDALLSPQRPSAASSVEQLRADGRDVGHALARLVRGDLAGLFDGPSTVAFDPSLPMLTLDLSAISGLRHIDRPRHDVRLNLARGGPVRPWPAGNVWSSTTKPGGCSPNPPCWPGCKRIGSCRVLGAWPT